MKAALMIGLISIFLLCGMQEQPIVSDAESRQVLKAFRLVMAVMCSSFMVLTAISFLRFRLRKKAREYQNLLKVFDMDRDQSHMPSIDGEFSAADYVLPVTFATFISLYFWAVIFLGVNWDQDMNTGGSILIAGLGDPDFKREGMLAVSYAFVGAFLWSANNITRRLISADLSPGIYYATGSRMLFASMVSLILAAVLQTNPWPGYNAYMLPATAFLTGMLPDQALRYVKERVRVFSHSEKDHAHKLELEVIEGINLYHKARLSEVGIDNAQNLAEADLIELLLKTPFSPRQVLDWMAQAKLYMFFTDDVSKLRQVGIRTVFDLYVDTPEALIPGLSKETEISALKLENIQRRIMNDPSVGALWHMQEKLARAGDSHPRFPEAVN